MTTPQKGSTARADVAAKVRGKAGELRVSAMTLAKETGIEYSALLRRMRGEVDFTAADLVLVAEALNVDVADLLPRREIQAVAS